MPHPADRSESMILLRKSIHSRLSNGGGTKHQYAAQSRLPHPADIPESMIWLSPSRSESMILLRKSTHPRLSNGGGAKHRYAARSRLPQPADRPESMILLRKSMSKPTAASQLVSRLASQPQLASQPASWPAKRLPIHLRLTTLLEYKVGTLR